MQILKTSQELSSLGLEHQFSAQAKENSTKTVEQTNDNQIESIMHISVRCALIESVKQKSQREKTNKTYAKCHLGRFFG
jgi:hypothetical protein